MNHLAHFFLSGQNNDLKLGNFIADFISNKDLPRYTEGVQKGVLLHRAIDAFTDAHPIVKQSTRRLHPFHHKYAPVIVDVYYDYLLGKNWHTFTKSAQLTAIVPDTDIPTFTQNIYNLLEIRKLELPQGLQRHIGHMIADNWLMQYTTPEGLDGAFRRIEKAATFDGNFKSAAQNLFNFLPEFDAEFQAFFPELLQHVTPFLAD